MAPSEPTRDGDEPVPTILVADDDPTIRELAGRILAREMPEFGVELAADGYEAFYQIGRAQPRLVILDVRMPGVNGLEICRKMRSHEALREIPILVVTAFSREYPRDRLLAAGASRVLEKPFDIVEFADAVRRLLEAPENPAPL